MSLTERSHDGLVMSSGLPEPGLLHLELLHMKLSPKESE